MSEFLASAVMKVKPEPGIEIGRIKIPQPGSSEVIIKVRAAGICGSDIHIYKWSAGYEWMEKLMPVVLGHEFAGEIVQLGEGVSTLHIGQRVVCKHIVPCGKCKSCLSNRSYLCQVCRPHAIGLRRNGGFANYVVVPAVNCLDLPDDVSFELGALVQPVVLTSNAVERSGLTIGDKVVFMGPGPIGLLTLAAAKLSGATEIAVIGTKGDEERLLLAKKLGATCLVKADEEDPVEAINRFTGGEGADLVFEAAGVGAAVGQGLLMLRPGGKLVSLAVHHSPVPIDITKFNRADLTMIGIHEGPITWERGLSLVRANTQVFSSFISRRFSLEEALEAFEMAIDRKVVKAMLIPGDGD
ncbi:MAG TPA: alcohol dehydrogenase catalytic domain-containing protein [Clostridia bacterium]|nr:alcohol dehydrogenase catalytic domain-containing protein [Clostridia bacterium]